MRTDEERRAKERLAATGSQFCQVVPEPMTREDHIRAAESLLAGRWERGYYKESYPDWREPTDHALAKAHVHALLAQVCPPARPAEPEPVAEPVVDEPHTPWLSWLRWGGQR